MATIEEVEPLDGARELIVDLKERGHTVVLASSAKEDEVEHYLDLLDARDLADHWTHSADVEETKPAPDLVQSALDKAGGHTRPEGVGGCDAVMVGDTPWDVEAAQRAGVQTLTVMTGGFAESELREAGAAAVYDSVQALRAGLEDTPLG